MAVRGGGRQGPGDGATSAKSAGGMSGGGCHPHLVGGPIRVHEGAGMKRGRCILGLCGMCVALCSSACYRSVQYGFAGGGSIEPKRMGLTLGSSLSEGIERLG